MAGYEGGGLTRWIEGRDTTLGNPSATFALAGVAVAKGVMPRAPGSGNSQIFAHFPLDEAGLCGIMLVAREGIVVVHAFGGGVSSQP